MEGTVDPQAIVQKLVVKIANVELRNAMLEVALESAQRELATLRGSNPEEMGN